MKYLLAIGALLISWASTAAEYPDITLDKLLTTNEQRLMGVSKLSAQEKDRLRLLLIEKYLEGYEKGRKKGIEDAITYQSRQKSTPDVIESKIDGDFEGWEGETVIKLINGQIWQQSEYWYHYHYAFMPKVLIFKSGGSYKMKVDGIDKPIGVRRLH